MKFSYLLGAGASAQIIPTVKKFPDALDAFLTTSQNLEEIFSTKDDVQKVKVFCFDLMILSDEVQKHASIDTYAKKLFLTGQVNELIKLKAILDSFLTAFQLTNEIDKRYDAFLATLLFVDIKTLKLPNNISILSWNYDFQFELSLSNFLLSNDIENIENKFKLIPNQMLDFSKIAEFNLIKLNGTAAGLINEDSFIRKNFLSIKTNSNLRESIPSPEDNQKVYLKIIRNYESLLKDIKNRTSSIMFAWEKNKIVSKVRAYANEKVSDTDILVVIGYSFPTFNREIDKELLKNMSSLKKIVIQAPSEDVDSIVFRVNSLLDNTRVIDIHKVTSIDEFFIPFEF